MTKLLAAYQKVHKIIISCETLEQVNTAKVLVHHFDTLFGIQELTNIFNLLLDRKIFLIENKIKPVVYFLIGPPGVGKSTYIEDILLPIGRYTIVSTDNIIVEKGKELNLNYNQAYRHFNFKDIEKEFYDKLKLAIVERNDIIIDKCNLSPKVRKRILRLLTDDYIKIAIIFDFSDVEMIMKRLYKRAIEEDKYISKRTFEDMLKSYVEPTLEDFNQIIKL